MYPEKCDLRLALAAVVLLGSLACNAASGFIAQATVTPTQTRRPTFTAVPVDTDTPAPVPTKAPTLRVRTPTRRPPTPRPPTPKPTAAPVPPTAPPAPTGSTYEFHANAPLPCGHASKAVTNGTYLKGTVYLARNDPSQRYAGAIVALGPPDGSTVWDTVKTGANGVYTFILSSPGQPRPGTWALWLVDPSLRRKSDIGGPIVTNDLPDSDPNSCWVSGVDFWK